MLKKGEEKCEELPLNSTLYSNINYHMNNYQVKNCSSVAITKHQYVSNFRICNEEVKAIFSLSQNALKILLCDQNLMRYVTLAHRYC